MYMKNKLWTSLAVFVFSIFSSIFLAKSVLASNGPDISSGIDTAIGNINASSEQGIANFFLGWGMGIGGAIGLIMMVSATFSIMTSAGDPRKLQSAKELFMSALSGLLMLVFAAYILKVIGVDILGILN